MRGNFEFLLAILVAACTLQCCSDTKKRYVPVQVQVPAPPTPCPPPKPDPRRLLSARSFDVGIGSINDQEPLAPTGRWLPTARGVLVWVPQAVELVPGRAAELLVQVDEAVTEPDTRLPLDARLPPGSRVIALPGAFEVGGSGFSVWAVGLAGGAVWPNDDKSLSLVCWVSWRLSQSDQRLLPALSHEIRHLLTGDPNAGHPGGCCNRLALGP